MRDIFVFGSNLAGVHGAGSALAARQHHGAVLGVGEGLTGDAYAIPTKSAHLRTLALGQIRRHVEKFCIFAVNHPEMRFTVVEIGCGLAGYTPKQIAPMFLGAPRANVILPESFTAVLYQTEGIDSETWLTNLLDGVEDDYVPAFDL